MSLEDLRRQYSLQGLREADVPGDPIVFFQQWMAEALQEAPADWVEPYATTLATSSRSGVVSARIVLLRGADDAGFVFYTNYDSLKGRELAENPQAALVFHWGYLERQVRVQGAVEKTDRALSEAYFRKRPRGSQVSAAISPQSEEVSSRETLEQQAAEMEQQLGGQPVPLPNNWGGYRLVPESIEFWQGRENRLHDRLQFVRSADGWQCRRLSP